MYGEGHFGEINLDVFFQLLRYFRPRGFREFARLLSQANAFRRAGIELRNYHDAQHVRGVVYRLAAVSCLNRPEGLAPDDPVIADQIDVGRLFHEPGFVYLHLPTMREPATARNAARLFLAALADHAHDRPEGADVQVLVAIDEFAEMGETNIAQFLRMVRSTGISVFLALQSLSSLRNPKMPDLEDTVKTCAGYKLILGADELTAQWLQFLSGEAGYAELAGWTHTPGLFSPGVDLRKRGALDPDPNRQAVQVRQAVRPALDLNFIREVSSRKDAGFIVTTFDAGVNQRLSYPTATILDWPLDLDEHRKLDGTPWPQGDAGTRAVTDLPSDHAPPPEEDDDTSPADIRNVLKKHLRTGLEGD
jgi:hypothetical protein